MYRYQTLFSGPAKNINCLWATGTTLSSIVSPEYIALLRVTEDSGVQRLPNGAGFVLEIESNGNTLKSEFYLRTDRPDLTAAYRGVDLLIGADFFSNKIVRFDFPGKMITLLDEFMTNDNKSYSTFTFSLFKGIPVVNVFIKGMWTGALIDTGYYGYSERVLKPYIFPISFKTMTHAKKGPSNDSAAQVDNPFTEINRETSPREQNTPSSEELGEPTILPFSHVLGSRTFEKGILVLDYQRSMGYWKGSTTMGQPNIESFSSRLSETISPVSVAFSMTSALNERTCRSNPR